MGVPADRPEQRQVPQRPDDAEQQARVQPAGPLQQPRECEAAPAGFLAEPVCRGKQQKERHNGDETTHTKRVGLPKLTRPSEPGMQRRHRGVEGGRAEQHHGVPPPTDPPADKPGTQVAHPYDPSDQECNEKNMVVG
jgi:hypothetical protein